VQNHVICSRCPECLTAVVLVDVGISYWTSKIEHIVVFTAIFSNICTAHAQKRLFVNFLCKFRHRRSTPRPRFPIRVQHFSDLATFSVAFCILYAKCPPYFYFRFVWPTDLESIPHASNPHADNSHQVLNPLHLFVLELWVITFAYSLYNFYWATTTIKGRLLSKVTNAKALDCVNFCAWPCDVDLWFFWPWTIVIYGGSRVQPCHQVWRPYDYSFMSCEL